MVALEDLRDARLTDVETLGATWRGYATKFAGLEQDAKNTLIAPMHHKAWVGDAGAAAYRHIDGVDEGFRLLAEQARAVGTLLDTAAARFTALQRRLAAIAQAATDAGARVRVDGSVEPAYLTAESADDLTALAAARRNNEAAKAFADQIGEVLDEATRLDDEYSAALARYEHPPSGVMSPSEVLNAAKDARDNAELLGADRSTIPHEKSAWVVREWWESLSVDQQQAYLTAYPSEIGSLNGIPATARDQANRAVLDQHLAEVDVAIAGAQRSPTEYREKLAADREATEKMIAKLDASEYGDPTKRLYLLGYNPEGLGRQDGRAIVAIGNPDTAHNVATFVPGVDTELNDMPDLMLKRAQALQFASDELTPQTGDVSVIAWLDYDAPELHNGQDLNLSPAGHERADQGAARLDAFVNGLHATHDGQAHYTVVGHSYGSTVVGTAASGNDGLAVDDIIVNGSPGMRVDQASDLHIDRHHVWAGAATDDFVANHTSDYSHGPSPVNAEFGANRFHVDTHGHGAYWNPGSESLTSQSAVVAGQYDYFQNNQDALDHTSDEGMAYRERAIRGDSGGAPR